MTHRAAILSAIQAGCHRTREIAERTGIRRELVRVRLAELVRMRAVSSFGTCATGKTGRPEHFYRIFGSAA